MSETPGADPAARRRPGPAGTRFCEVHRFEELDSTNGYLLDMARAGGVEGLVAVAGHQRAGRGRRGRRWEAPPGTGLLLSVLLRPRLDHGDLHLLTVAVALAARSTCVEAGVAPRLKWPNDLVVEDRKLAGILAESPAPPVVVVGMGLNVSWSPPGATSLVAEGGHPPAPPDLVDPFLLALEPRLAALGSPEGRHETMARYRALSATLGRRVSVELPGETLRGRAVDVDDSGHLLLDVDGARRTVTAGDVVHLRDH